MARINLRDCTAREGRRGWHDWYRKERVNKNGEIFFHFHWHGLCCACIAHFWLSVGRERQYAKCKPPHSISFFVFHAKTNFLFFCFPNGIYLFPGKITINSCATLSKNFLTYFKTTLIDYMSRPLTCNYLINYNS